MEPLIFPTQPVRLAEAEFKWGGAVTPAITCVGAELIYVYEVREADRSV